jgi:hypothetical protein
VSTAAANAEVNNLITAALAPCLATTTNNTTPAPRSLPLPPPLPQQQVTLPPKTKWGSKSKALQTPQQVGPSINVDQLINKGAPSPAKTTGSKKRKSPPTLEVGAGSNRSNQVPIEPAHAKKAKRSPTLTAELDNVKGAQVLAKAMHAKKTSKAQGAAGTKAVARHHSVCTTSSR